MSEKTKWYLPDPCKHEIYKKGIPGELICILEQDCCPWCLKNAMEKLHFELEEARKELLAVQKHWQMEIDKGISTGIKFDQLKAELEKMKEDRDRWADSACRLEPKLLAANSELDEIRKESEKWRKEAFRQYPTPEAYDAACSALRRREVELDEAWGEVQAYEVRCDNYDTTVGQQTVELKKLRFELAEARKEIEGKEKNG